MRIVLSALASPIQGRDRSHVLPDRVFLFSSVKSVPEILNVVRETGLPRPKRIVPRETNVAILSERESS